MQALDPMDIMRELEPAVESNLNRHLSVAQEWMPHEYVPWRKGRDFAGDEGLAWSPDQSTLSPVAQLAFDEIGGRFSSEDLLGRIFASFCIGK